MATRVDNRAGCLFTAALNFNSFASKSGVCWFPVPGCIDSLSLNFWPGANVDDGSCVSKIAGCMSPTATNYNAAANRHQPHMCTYTGMHCDAPGNSSACRPGCIYPEASNFALSVNVHDGSCRYRTAADACAPQIAAGLLRAGERVRNYLGRAPFLAVVDATAADVGSHPVMRVRAENGNEQEAALRWHNLLRARHCAAPLLWDDRLANEAKMDCTIAPTASVLAFMPHLSNSSTAGVAAVQPLRHDGAVKWHHIKSGPTRGNASGTDLPSAHGALGGGLYLDSSQAEKDQSRIIKIVSKETVRMGCAWRAGIRCTRMHSPPCGLCLPCAGACASLLASSCR